MARIIWPQSMRMTALGLIALGGFGGGAAWAQDTPQDKPQGQFEGKVNVNDVLLDVLVTDARGNVVVGLDANDFVVTEKGKPVTLNGVTFYSNRSLVEASPTADQGVIKTAEATEDRYFILLFEDQKDVAQEAPRLLSQSLEAAKRARGWVENETLPNDWVAVASYDTKLKVQQDFTHDRKALIAAIADAVKGKDREGNYPSRVDATKGPSLLAGLPTGTGLRDKTPTLYEALQVIAEAGGEIRGRKNLLLFTFGLPGREDTFGSYVPDKRYFEPTVQALNANNVAAYAIDLTPPAVEHTLSDSLNKLAIDTGGRYFFNVTNFSTPLDQVAKENNGYYLLSYSGEQPAGKAGFQEVQVKTTNPEFRVKARRGYEYGK